MSYVATCRLRIFLPTSSDRVNFCDISQSVRRICQKIYGDYVRPTDKEAYAEADRSQVAPAALASATPEKAAHQELLQHGPSSKAARLMAARCASCRLSTNTRGNACCSNRPATSRSSPGRRCGRLAAMRLYCCSFALMTSFFALIALILSPYSLAPEVFCDCKA